MIRVRGTVQRQLFNDPMSGYSVYSIKPYTPYPEGLVISKYGTISISGEIEFRTGTEVDINVILNEESQYEGSYFFCGFGAITMNGDRVHLNETETAQILAQYMTESQVNNVMEAYPDFIDKVLNGEKDQVDYKKIYNVGKKRILEYFDKIEKNCRDIIFFSVCADWGIKDAKLVSTMYDTKEQFVEALEKDPYEILCGRLGMEFIDVDPLIVDRYPAHETDYNRCLYDMLSFITNSETTGSTRINTEELLEVVKDEAFEAVEHFEKCLEDVRIHYEDGTVARQCTYEKEKYIAEDLKRRLAEVQPIEVDETKFFENEGMVLSDEQRQILSVVKNNGVAMLTGGAGCGKSFTTRAVVDMLENAGLTVTLLAPTGIASRRLREATLRPASTIHMMLAKQQTTGDVAVIDEVGMVSVELLFNLLRDGTNPDTRIVFVCDPAQLVSISCGNIAQDLMSSGSVPIVNLTKVFRYGTGGIATVATDIRNGKKDSLKTEWNDYNFADIGKLPMKQIVDQYQELLDSGYKPKDILVLTPFNKGTEGTVAINNQLQKFNPNELTEIGYKAERQNVHFKIGDKVINKKNNYHACVADASEEDGEDIECFIANGEIGFIRDLGVNNGCAYMTIEFTDNLVYMCGKELENIKLGYSLTVHSCQGCEAKAVIMVMDSCHSRLATRNLLYVGCTRAKERLSIIGNAETISGAIDRVENLERNTWLGELLKEN